MKRTVNEICAYISTVLFALSCWWAIGSERSMISMVAMVITTAVTFYFAIETISETVREIRRNKR